MGEYISLGKVENVLKTSQFIENICVYGDSEQKYCVAIIVPQRQNVLNLACKEGLTSNNFDELCENPNVIKALHEDLKIYAKQGEY